MTTTTTRRLPAFAVILSVTATALSTPSFALDTQPLVVAQASDMALTCTQLTSETNKVTQLIIAAANANSVPTAASGQTAAANARAVDPVTAAYNTAQMQARVADIQMKAAQAGWSAGQTSAVTSGLMALAAAKNAGGAAGAGAALQDTVASTAAQQIAARIPGGALVSGLMGGMFSHKKKAAAVVADAPNPALAQNQQIMQLGQQRITFLQSLQTSKKC